VGRAHQCRGTRQRHDVLASHGRQRTNVAIDRKIPADIAVVDPSAFTALTKLAARL
jgi:ribosomal protein L20